MFLLNYLLFLGFLLDDLLSGWHRLKICGGRRGHSTGTRRRVGLAPAPARGWRGERALLGAFRLVCVPPAPEAGGYGRAEAVSGQRRPELVLGPSLYGLGDAVVGAHAGRNPRRVGGGR